MKYREALIAWSPGTDKIRVGHLLGQHDRDWTEHPISYDYTGGAAYTEIRQCKDKNLRDLMMFIEFHTIVVRDEVPISAAHREFLKIDEYRQRISADIEGAELTEAYS